MVLLEFKKAANRRRVANSWSCVQYLVVPERVAGLLAREILRSNPSEICGLLFGRIRTHRACVEGVIFCRNLAFADDEFIVYPIDIDHATRRIPAGRSLLGIVHSHSGSARASTADRRCMKLHRYFWLIVGNASTGVGSKLTYCAYRSTGGGGVARMRVVAPWKQMRGL